MQELLGLAADRPRKFVAHAFLLASMHTALLSAGFAQSGGHAQHTLALIRSLQDCPDMRELTRTLKPATA